MIKCPICQTMCKSGVRWCDGCGSVERHRALVNLLTNKQIDIQNKKILILSEGKRSNGKYYETSYYLAKHSDLTTMDIMDHSTYFGDTQTYDIYESIEKAESFKDNTFDIVIACHVLTAVENDLNAISEMSRILKNDGILIINDGINKPVSEPYVAKNGQYTRRHYNKTELINVFDRFFDEVKLEISDDLIYCNGIEFIVCKNKKNVYEIGSTTPYCDSGWWRHIIVVYGLSRTGNSSLEKALQQLGLNTIFIDEGRVKSDNKMEQYTKFHSNINENKPFFEGIKENVFLLGSKLKNEIDKIYEYYPGVKIICTDRNDDDWVISMKIHNLVADRPNPKREDLIKEKSSFINNINTQVSKLEFFDQNNFLKLSVDENNKLELLCNFLHIKKEDRDFIYPQVSTNSKIELTREQIDF